MGADMLAATLLSRVGVPLDFDAGRRAVEEFEIGDVSEDVIGELYDEWEYDGISEDGFDNFDPKATLLKVVDRLDEAIHSRGVTFHTYGDLEVWIAGGMSWGDPDEGCQPMWTISCFPKILRAIGFLDRGDIVITFKGA